MLDRIWGLDSIIIDIMLPNIPKTPIMLSKRPLVMNLYSCRYSSSSFKQESVLSFRNVAESFRNSVVVDILVVVFGSVFTSFFEISKVFLSLSFEFCKMYTASGQHQF